MLISIGVKFFIANNQIAHDHLKSRQWNSILRRSRVTNESHIAIITKKIASSCSILFKFIVTLDFTHAQYTVHNPHTS